MENGNGTTRTLLQLAMDLDEAEARVRAAGVALAEAEACRDEARNGIRSMLGDPVPPRTRRRDGATRALLLKLLSDGGDHAAGDIAKSLGRSQAQIGWILARELHRRAIVKASRGVYRAA